MTLTHLAALNRALASPLESALMWEAVREALESLFDTMTLFIALYQREQDQLTFLLLVDDLMLVEDAPPLPLCGISRAVIRGNQPLRFDDLSTPDAVRRLHQLGTARDEREPSAWARAWMGAPLHNRSGDVIGLICLQNAIPAAYHQTDFDRLMVVAGALELALDNQRLTQAERERRLIAEGLTKIGQILSQHVDHDDVLDRMLDQCQRVVGYDSAVALMLDVADKRAPGSPPGFIITTTHDPDRFIRGTLLFPRPDSPPARAAAVQQPFIAYAPDGTGEWWQSPGSSDTGRGGAPGAWLIAPMVTHDHVVGMLLLGRHGGRGYAEHEASAVFALARQGAIALENARLYAQSRAHASTLQQRARRLASLNRMSGLIGLSLNSIEVLNTTAQILNELFEVDHCGIVLFDQSDDPQTPSLTATLAAEHPPTGAVGLKISLENNPTMAHLIELGTAIAIDDAHDPALDEVTRATLQRVNTQSTLIAPLIARDRVIGSIGIDMVRHARRFTAEEREMIMTIAGQVAMAITNAQLYEQALTANRLKSAFLANISHELRTPLNAIIGYSEMLIGEFYGALNPQQLDRVNRIHTSGKHLLSLIDDVLDLSKIEAGQVVLARTQMRFSDILDQVIAEVQPMADAKGLSIDTHIPPDEGYILADPRALHQIVSNLVQNAVKFTRQGGVTITIETVTWHAGQTHPVWQPPQRLNLPSGVYIALSVIDTGIGIAPEDQEIIFDSFRQADNSAVREFGGTGLGLSIGLRLVRMHNGWLWVQSVLEQGSRFIVFLPALTEIILYPAPQSITRDARAFILVLDDDAMTIQLIQDALDPAHYQVVGVSAPADGLLLAKHTPPDLVITDIMMPGLSGWEVLQQLKDDPATRHVPVVIISILDHRIHGPETGAAGYLSKPIDRAALNSVIQRTLHESTRA
jgi:signal transduction histidine kinase/CheY-like chemotaxis protein